MRQTVRDILERKESLMMSLKRRVFTKEFKLKVVAEVEAGKPQSQVARQYQISQNTISKWRKQCAQIQRACISR